jgi:hypothetical protein
MKFALGKAIILGLAVAAASFTGCSSDHSRSNSSVSKENAGDLGLQLAVGDLTVNKVHYVLTNGPNSYTGDLDVTDASTLTAVIGGVVAGSGYTLTLTATATDGTSQCAGSASGITVTANQTATVAVELRCTKARNRGSVLINGSVNECPDITSVVGDAPNGCLIALHANATDDGQPNPPGALSYTWTGPAGLSSSTIANPVLNCQSAGPQAFTVTVSDGDPDPTCAQTFGVTVVCPTGCPSQPPSCTDMIANNGETDVDCGGTQTPACPRCALGKKCVVDGDCAAGAFSCQGGICKTPPTCTDGIQNGTETGVDCGGVSSGVTCPPCPSPTAQALANHAPACLTCCNGKTACKLLLTNSPCEGLTTNAAAGPAMGQPRATLCLNLLNKELSTKCGTVGVNGATDCYCGSATDTCFTTNGAANGLAKAEEEAGLETTTAATIEGSFSSTALGGGRANSLYQSLVDNSCTACF